jgi:hypothetical protein
MKTETKNAILLASFQIICHLVWYILAMRGYFYIWKPYLIMITPVILVGALSLPMSLFFPIKVIPQNAILVSVTSSSIYFIVYILRLIIIGFNVEYIPFYCVFLLPLCILTIFVSGFAVWMGSFLNTKLFKQKG